MEKSPQSQELCPDCGNFVDELNEWTGFCFECTPSIHSLITVSRMERWLIKNADAIEQTMIENEITAKQAVAYISTTHKARCIVCNNVIKHGTYGRHFICNTTPECRKARRRYKYLIYDKGLSKEAALTAITTPQQEHS